MKISKALESMVADLVSDEKQKREEIEAVLSQIAELVEVYRETGDRIGPSLATSALQAPPQPSEPQPEPTLDAQFENLKQMNLRRGDDDFTAERKAKMALGMDV